MSDHPLLVRLRQLALPEGHYTVFGSGPLLARGLIDDVGDLDVLVRGPAWTTVAEHGEIVYLDAYDVDVVAVDGGVLTFGRTWGIGTFDVDDLIDTAEIVDGLPFVALRHVAAYKRIAHRPKDVRHLEVLREAGLLGE
jgi:hypothetical protein